MSRGGRGGYGRRGEGRHGGGATAGGDGGGGEPAPDAVAVPGADPPARRVRRAVPADVCAWGGGRPRGARGARRGSGGGSRWGGGPAGWWWSALPTTGRGCSRSPTRRIGGGTGPTCSGSSWARRR